MPITVDWERAMNNGSEFKGAPADVVERRRKPRYLFSQAMTIRAAEGVAMHGISVEMSETGMSAMVKGLLKAGDSVELEPVAGGATPAVVVHKLGRLYGFQFVGLTAERATRIAEDCLRLARYRSQTRGS